jgi:hypothetical protein
VNFDSSIVNFFPRVPLPWTYVNLGNLGTAAENRMFSPMYKSGWDAGFHAFDRYEFKLEDTRFYTTTRPYSELNYLLGASSEQQIEILHTQNIKPTWNAAFQYKLISSPGTFQNQNTNHNNYRLTSWYESPNKRYRNFFVLLGNKLVSGENGGILLDANYLDSSVYQQNRFIIPTNLGGSSLGSRNFFSTNVGTGNFYTTAHYVLRQQFDFGKKDSLVINDTTVIKLFYPRLRLEHTASYNTYNYRYKDARPDSLYYFYFYNYRTQGEVYLRDLWQQLVNDFSIYQFPDAKNSQQFIKLGARMEIMSGDFDTGNVKKSFVNTIFHGEYRNKTKNKKWDLGASGQFSFQGPYAGDYDMQVKMLRVLGKKSNALQLGFENVNRNPSFNFNQNSNFAFVLLPGQKKENSTHVFGGFSSPQRKMSIGLHFHLLANYTYYKSTIEFDQESSLFNVMQLRFDKDFALGRRGWHWRTSVLVQQKTGSAQVNLPLVSTQNQLAYDGSLGFKNLWMSTGLEFRYFTKYKANYYSPLNGQFYYQNEQDVAMRLPDITAYMHFRIRSFTAYVRAENLNSLEPVSFTFVKNNQLVMGYPSPGLQIRVGVFWSFVN